MKQQHKSDPSNGVNVDANLHNKGSIAPYIPLPRRLAALVVVVSHAPSGGFLPDFFSNQFGATGVSAFFLLSGFLMMHFAVERPFNAHMLRQYTIARIGRVLPLFYLALVVTTLIWTFSGFGFFEIDSFRNLIGNWLLIKGTDVLWSIPVEIHFYVLFPLLWFAHNNGRFLLAGILALSLSIVVIGSTSDPNSQLTLPYWMHFFVLGALLRRLLDDGEKNRLPWKLNGFRIQILAISLFSALVLLPPKLREILFGWPIPVNYLDPLVLILLPLVLWFSCAPVGPFRLFSTRPLKWLGSISFGLYLIHSPMITVISYFQIGQQFGPFVQFLIVLIGSCLGATATYYLFEQPVQNAIRRKMA